MHNNDAGGYIRPPDDSLRDVADALNLKHYAWTGYVGKFNRRQTRHLAELEADLRRGGYRGGPLLVRDVEGRGWETVVYDTEYYGPLDVVDLPF
jgi:hypothetical protein